MVAQVVSVLVMLTRAEALGDFQFLLAHQIGGTRFRKLGVMSGWKSFFLLHNELPMSELGSETSFEVDWRELGTAFVS